MEGSIFSTLTSNELGIFFTGLGVALSAILSGIGSAIGVGKAGQGRRRRYSRSAGALRQLPGA